jgi:hypothetical protein
VWNDILCSMRARFPRAVVTLVLAICLVCPLVELFDHWDHTMQTGNDTEYALVVLALCVGVAYSFARFILKCPLARFGARSVSYSCVHKPLLSTLRGFIFLLFSAISPPTIALRI